MSERLSSTRLALIGRRAWDEHGPLRTSEPIAIVGMACRFPGNVKDPDSLWELLLSGRDAVGEVPADRWSVDGWYDPDPATPGRTSTRWGGFIDQVGGFDAPFFDISPAEADRMDPQQRLALEVAYEAFESSGVPTTRLRGTEGGVYFASYHSDYAMLQYSDLESVNARTLTGALHSVVANRISYVFGMNGPSLAIDSACSSSLVAVHLACQGLRSRDCNVALAGGVNLMITPNVTVALSKGGFMSPTGRCRVFDAAADGFVRSDGCAAVVLKRLADAIADGNEVIAVIRGSAVNQDGESTNLAAPNGLAQEALVRRALRNAGMSPDDVSLIEAHGTGTQLGDPIETDALASVYRERRPEAGPCYLGSLKASIGHAEAAAGVGGLVKTILCMRERTIPPHVHFRRLNSHIDLTGTSLEIVREPTAWNPPSETRVATVSSFGVGGTNAQVIVEEPPSELRLPSRETAYRFVLPISAKHPESLTELCRRHVDALRKSGSVPACCEGAARGRTHHRPYRIAATGGSPATLLDALEVSVEALTIEPPSELDAAPPELCMVYSGQGTQWPGMGLELMEREEVFASSIRRIEELWKEESGLSLIDELALPREASRLDRTDVAQVAIFSIQVALTEQLAHWGVRPACVVGHSVGEIAAAWAAGLMSLEEALGMVVSRGRAMQEEGGEGRMLAVRAEAPEVTDILIHNGSGASIAAVNGPRSLVLAGSVGEVEDARTMLASSGFDVRLLDVRFAFHTPLMHTAARRQAEEGVTVTPREPTIPMISTVDGTIVDRFDHEYVARNICSPVRFSDAIAVAAKRGYRHFVEIGSHPALGSDVLSTLEEQDTRGRIAYALHSDKDAGATTAALLGRLYEWGVDPQWEAVYPGSYSVRDVPTYPWHRQQHWLPVGPNSKRSDDIPRSATAFPGRRVDSPALLGHVFELQTSDAPIVALRDHRLAGSGRMPATAIAELFRCAAIDAGLENVAPVSVTLLRPVEIDDPARLQVLVEEDGQRAELVRRTSEAGSEAGSWEQMASCEFGAPGEPASSMTGEWRGEPLSPSEFYDALAAQGCTFGRSFRLLDEINVGEGRAVGRVASDAISPWDGPIHPAVVDACAQLCTAVLANEGLEAEGPFLPWAIDRYDVWGQTTEPVTGRVRLRAVSPGGASFDVDVVGPGDLLLARLEGWQVRSVPVASEALAVRSWSERTTTASNVSISGNWIVAGEGRVLDAVAGGLSAAGAASAVRVPVESLAETWESSVGWSGVVCGFEVDAPAAPRGTDVPTVGPHQSDLLPPAGAEHRCWQLLEWVRQVIRGERTIPRVLVLTRGAQELPPFTPSRVPSAGDVLGLLRAVRTELPEIPVMSLDLDPTVRAVSDDEEVQVVLRELLEESQSREAAVRYGRRLTADAVPGSLRPAPPGHDRPGRLVHDELGTMGGFRIVPQTEFPVAASGEVVIRVLAAGVNFRDVLTSLGTVAGDGGMGQECCGEVVSIGEDVETVSVGDRVVAFWPGCFASLVRVPEIALVKAPVGLDPAASATLPIAFATAWFALREVASLEEGQKVLVHAAAGGVGMAAVQVARACGARVLGTAGTPEKRDLLAACGVDEVFDSRTAAFEEHVLRVTGGAGVDVVLNSLTGAMIPAGLRCLASNGLFIELGKREILSTRQVAKVRGDVRYRAFDLREEADADPGLTRRLLEPIVAAVESRALRPLPASVSPLDRAEDVFRHMARGDHVGKLLLAPPSAALESKGGWVIITGGTGALGMITCRWLLEHGWRRIALLSRGGGSPACRAEIADLSARHDAHIRAERVDVAEAGALSKVIRGLRNDAPITGVIHAAGVSADAVLDRVDLDSVHATMSPKVAGVWNLHCETLADPLHFFILYSAAGPHLDATALAAYSAANGFLDGFAVWRRGCGLPAVSVLWGPWRGEGMAARLEERHRRRWAEMGLGEWTAQSATNPLGEIFSTRQPQVFALRMEGRSAAAPSTSGGNAGRGLAEELRTLPRHRRRAAVVERVLREVRVLLGTGSTPSEDAPLRDAGLDSLGAVELRNTLTRAVGVSLPATLAFDHPTAIAIAIHILESLGHSEREGIEPVAPVIHPDVSADVEALTDEEAEALLLLELDGGGPE